MFYSKKLKKFKNIKHCFFSRKDGFSKGLYKSLNCGKGSKDNKKIVKKNISYVRNKLKSKRNNIVLLHQIHSSKIFLIKKFPKKKLIGDALITDIKNLPLGILTADCVPIFILNNCSVILFLIKREKDFPSPVFFMDNFKVFLYL